MDASWNEELPASFPLYGILISDDRPAHGLGNNRINNVFRRRNPSARRDRLVLRIFRGPAEDAPR